MSNDVKFTKRETKIIKFLAEFSDILADAAKPQITSLLLDLPGDGQAAIKEFLRFKKEFREEALCPASSKD